MMSNKSINAMKAMAYLYNLGMPELTTKAHPFYLAMKPGPRTKKNRKKGNRKCN